MAGQLTTWVIIVVVIITSTTRCQDLSYQGVDLPDFPDERSRRKVIVTTILDEPYMMLKEDAKFLAGNSRFEGYLADILERLSDALDFDYELRLVKDGRHGSLNPLGFWDGMIGELLREEAELAAGPITITPRRQQVLQFTDPFLSLRSTALLRKPSAQQRRAGLSRLRRVDALLQSNLTFGVVRGDFTESMLREASDDGDGDDLHSLLWSRMQEFGGRALVQSTQEGIERAAHGDYALILDTPQADYIINRRPCNFYTVEPFLNLRQYAFAVRPGEPLLHAINDELRRLIRSNDMQYMYLRWWQSECERRPRLSKKADDVTVTSSESPRQPAVTADTHTSCGARLGWSATVAISFMFLTLFWREP